MSASKNGNKALSKLSINVIFEILGKSFRFRFFMFIFLIYLAGATLNITNTNPGSRFMLTKEIAQNGDFAIREEVREYYSYLDFSVINQITNPGFEEGDSDNQSIAWLTNGLHSNRTSTLFHSGNYSFQLQSQTWVGQEFTSIDVNKIYENYTLTFYASRDEGESTYLRFTFHFTDSSNSTYWIRVNSLFFRKYSLQFSENDQNRSISSFQIENMNSSTVFLDDFEIYYSYSDKPPGVSLLAVPIYWAGEVIYTQLMGRNELDWRGMDDFIKFVTMICVLIFGAFTVLKMYDFLRLEGINHTNSHRVALLYGLGSLYYVYVGTFFSHSITAGLILLVLYQGSIFRKTGSYTSLLWSSILAGYMVVCDYIFLFFLPFFYLYLFIPILWKPNVIRKTWREYLKYYLVTNTIFLIPMVICGLLVTYYNYLSFGGPFTTPYSFARFFKDVQHFAAPMMDGLEILLTSSHHGLFTFMPIILISILGIIPMYRKSPALAVMCITAPLMLISLYSKYYLPTGGLAYGPRQLVPIVPFIILPLAFLLNQQIPRNPFSSIHSLVEFIIQYFLKISAGILGILTFLINFAGGWVGVYPLGGQSMANPIWGSIEQEGHLDAMFSWINLNLDYNGKLTLDLLQGHYMGEIHIDLIFASFTLNIHWPAASSLALHEISAFAGILFLILLVNPYFPLTNLGPFLRKKLNNLHSKDKNDIFLKAIVILGCSILSLFIIWAGVELISILGFPFNDIIVNLWNDLVAIKKSIGDIPIISFVSEAIFPIIFVLLDLLFFRSPYFTVQRWLFSSFLYLVCTAILTFADETMTFSNNKETNNQRNQIFFYANQLLGALYFGESIITIYLFNSGSSLYSEYVIIILTVILLVIANSTLLAQVTEPKENEAMDTERKISKFDSEELGTTANLIESLFALGITCVSSVIFGIIIISQVIENRVPLSDLIFIRPFNDLFSIRNWFFQGINSVPIYLILVLLIQIMIFILLLVDYRSKRNQSIPSIPKEVREEREIYFRDHQSTTGFQSVLLIGGWCVVFFYLLITVLYSTLSSVPDPSSLLTYPEELDLFFFLLIIFIITLVYTGTHKIRKELIETIKKNITSISQQEKNHGGN